MGNTFSDATEASSTETTTSFSGSYVPTNAHSTDRINSIVDNLLTPRLLHFRQVFIYDEEAEYISGTTWRLTYRNWNSAYSPIVRLNTQKVTPSSIDYDEGSVALSEAYTSGDSVTVTYNFDWFPVAILAGFIYQSIDIINNSGITAPTDYTISDAPNSWDGVITDLAFAMAMEKLLLDYDLWYGRLIFAIPNMEEGGDVIGQIETLKSNAEERAQIALNNEKFKNGTLLSTPTSNYFSAIRGSGGMSQVNQSYTGRLRGWRQNKYT